jgi:hypothetical protein
MGFDRRLHLIPVNHEFSTIASHFSTRETLFSNDGLFRKAGFVEHFEELDPAGMKHVFDALD